MIKLEPTALKAQNLNHQAIREVTATNSKTRSVQQQLSHTSEYGTILCQDPLSATSPPPWVWLKLTIILCA